MGLPLDLRAPRRKRAAAAWAVAHHEPLPAGLRTATPYTGKPARKLYSLVERTAHLPVNGEWDAALERLLFPPASTAELRRAIAGVGAWGIRHAAQIGYTESAPDRDEFLELAPFTLPLDPLDCSKWTQLMFFWARVPKSHDPMGTGYRRGGNTEQLLATGRALGSLEDLEIGDGIVWGRKGVTHHAAVKIGPGTSPANPLLCSHGRQACPCAVLFADEDRAQAGRPATPLSWLG